jgi:hypothetical protein
MGRIREDATDILKQLIHKSFNENPPQLPFPELLAKSLVITWPSKQERK